MWIVVEARYVNLVLINLSYANRNSDAVFMTKMGKLTPTSRTLQQKAKVVANGKILVRMRLYWTVHYSTIPACLWTLTLRANLKSKSKRKSRQRSPNRLKIQQLIQHSWLTLCQQSNPLILLRQLVLLLMTFLGNLPPLLDPSSQFLHPKPHPLQHGHLDGLAV